MYRKTLLTLVAGLAIASTSLAEVQLLDRIVAVVNSGVVLESELRQEAAGIVQQLRAQGTPLPSNEVLISQVLDRLIVKEVQFQLADDMGLEISDAVLNRSLEEIASRNGLTLSQLPAELARDGIDYAEFRERTREDLALSLLTQREVISRINITEREIERFLEQVGADVGNAEYDLYHMLISVTASATPEEIAAAEQEARELIERIRAGEEFGRLAVAYSDGQQALNGGRLGFRKGNELPSLFAEDVRAMKTGETRGPIRSPSGFHIIKVNEIRRAGGETVIVKQRHVRHILVRPSQILSPEAALQKIKSIRDRILGGENFEDVARIESDDTITAAQGGDLEWSNPGTFAPEFEEVLSRIEIGELSEPVRTRFGYHILELLGLRDYDQTDEVLRRRASNAIRASKAQEATELWLQNLRDEAFVEVLL